jgi:hypothetical protein
MVSGTFPGVKSTPPGDASSLDSPIKAPYPHDMAGGEGMGIVYADLILKNAVDVNNVWRGYISSGQIHQAKVRAMIDTGAGTLIIGEDLRRKLGLSVKGLRGAIPLEDMDLIIDPKRQELIGAHGDEVVTRA